MIVSEVKGDVWDKGERVKLLSRLQRRGTDLEGYPWRPSTKGDSVLTVHVDQWNLKSLKGCPPDIDGPFDCSKNRLTTLRGVPRAVHGAFLCDGNQLSSFEGAPETIGGNVYATFNKIKTISMLHRTIKLLQGNLDVTGNPIKGGVLSVFLIEDLESVTLAETPAWEAADFVNDHLLKMREGSSSSASDRRKAMLECQEEMMAAGLEEYASL